MKQIVVIALSLAIMFCIRVNAQAKRCSKFFRPDGVRMCVYHVIKSEFL